MRRRRINRRPRLLPADGASSSRRINRQVNCLPIQAGSKPPLIQQATRRLPRQAILNINSKVLNTRSKARNINSRVRLRRAYRSRLPRPATLRLALRCLRAVG